MPALAKKMSRPPKRSSAVWTRSWTSSSLPASAWTARAAAPISAAVSSWPLRSAQTTFAPSAAKRIALARPMPEPAPVTMAILSASLDGPVSVIPAKAGIQLSPVAADWIPPSPG